MTSSSAPSPRARKEVSRAADAEFASFRRAMGLTELDELDLVRTPLDPGVIHDYAGIVVGGSPFNVTDPEATKTDVQRRVEADLERLARCDKPQRRFPDELVTSKQRHWPREQRMRALPVCLRAQVRDLGELREGDGLDLARNRRH